MRSSLRAGPPCYRSISKRSTPVRSGAPSDQPHPWCSSALAQSRSQACAVARLPLCPNRCGGSLSVLALVLHPQKCARSPVQDPDLPFLSVALPLAPSRPGIAAVREPLILLQQRISYPAPFLKLVLARVGGLTARSGSRLLQVSCVSGARDERQSVPLRKVLSTFRPVGEASGSR
jgi:hypothetical protein